MRLWTLLVLLSACVTAINGSLRAGAGCSCSVSPPDSSAINSDAVVVGVVTDVRLQAPWWQYLIEYLKMGGLLERLGLERFRYPISELQAQIRVLYSWKDPADDSIFFRFETDKSGEVAGSDKAPTLTVRTPTFCFTSSFELGEHYVVYAHQGLPLVGDWGTKDWRTGDPLRTTYCDGTSYLKDARYDLLMLGSPVTDYRLPSDTTTLVTARSLSEQDRKEILADAAWRAIGFIYFEVREKDAAGYHLWYRPNDWVEWVPAGVVRSLPVDQGNWVQVTAELRDLAPHVWEDYDHRDWSAHALRGH
jgi:hypothetical protein